MLCRGAAVKAKGASVPSYRMNGFVECRSVNLVLSKLKSSLIHLLSRDQGGEADYANDSNGFT